MFIPAVSVWLFFCGDDPVTGQNFDHRKQWVEDRLQELSATMAVVLVRTRPDLAAQWSDEEVARHWWQLFPKRRDEQGRPAEPEDHELAMLLADAEAVAERRRRLSSLSWFMRCLSEPIARRANKEDGVSGRFFEGRFKCQKLLDEAAILACSVYVDRNPVRAGIADTPEQSTHTSAYQRIQGRQQRQAEQEAQPNGSGSLESHSVVEPRPVRPNHLDRHRPATLRVNLSVRSCLTHFYYNQAHEATQHGLGRPSLGPANRQKN